MDAYLWIDSKTGDAMVTRRDGTVEKIELPDEMYEDLLHARMRSMKTLDKWGDELLAKMNTPEQKQIMRDIWAAGWIVPPQNATPVDPVDPDDELGELDMEWDDEEVTQPMGLTPDQIWELQDQWKKDGLCPQCGHKGEWRGMACVCPKHGKFMG